MKKLISSFVVFVLCSAPVLAMEQKECPPTPPASADLGRVKALSGKWVGTTTHADGKTEPAASEYKVTSGGSAVVETLFPDTPQEMVSVYHDKAGRLSMTHYCMLGNQPELDLKSVTGGKMSFDMSAESHDALKNQMHMHSLILTLKDGNHLKQEWTNFNNNKKADTAVFEFTRKM